MKKLLMFLTLIMLLAGCSDKESQVIEVEEPPAVEEITEAEVVEENVTEEVEEIEIENEVIILKTAEIVNGDHDVSALITIYSDNTMELTNFNYDGKAPDVYVAIGNKDENGKFHLVELVSEKIEGKQENTSLTYTLNELESFNAISIWCHRYTEDFGSGILNNVSQ